VKLLLDTHVVLWAASEPSRLSATAAAAIVDPANDVLVSVVTAWEIAIKQSIGKLTLPEPAAVWVPQQLVALGFDVLGLDLDAALRVGALPFHHRDPFDRLLVAHAASTGCTIVTHDEMVKAYGVAIIAT
jgi:PIN domain nuclease of toxin-antitoxin system